MKTVTINAYRLSELSEKAKDNAYTNWLNSGPDYAFTSDNRASLDRFCDTFPAQAEDWSYDSMRGACRMRSSAGENVESLKGLRLRTWILNNYGHILYHPKTTYFTRKHNGGLAMNSVGVDGGKYVSKVQVVEHACPLTGYYIDDEILQPIRDFIAHPDASTTWEDLAKACGDAWAEACRADAEYCQSEEYFTDEADANEYHYTESGNKCVQL